MPFLTGKIVPGKRSQRGIWRTQQGRVIDAAKSMSGFEETAAELR